MLFRSNPLLAAYLSQLATHPLRTKAITSGTSYHPPLIMLTDQMQQPFWTNTIDERIQQNSNAMLHSRSPRLTHREIPRPTTSQISHFQPLHPPIPLRRQNRQQGLQDGAVWVFSFSSLGTLPCRASAEGFCWEDERACEGGADFGE